MKKLLVIFSLIAALTVAAYFYFTSGKELSYEFITVKRENLTQEVSVTGRVKPAKSAVLAFEKSGKVKAAYIGVGDKIKINQILAELEDKDLQAQLNKAQAQVASAQAQLKSTQANLENAKAVFTQYQSALEKEKVKLTELQKGTRSEEVQIAESKVAKAKQALIDAQENLRVVQEKADTDFDNIYKDVADIINDAYTSGDDAINKQLKNFFNKSSDNYKLTFSTTDTQAKTDCEFQRLSIDQELSLWKREVNQLSPATTYDELDQALNQANDHLVVIKNFLIRTMDALNLAISTSSVTETILTTYRTNLMTARTNINTELTNINNQKQAISAQKATNQNNLATAETNVNTASYALMVTQDELALTKAGATAEQVAAQEAVIRQAQANLDAQTATEKQIEAEVENREALLKQTQAEIDNVQAQIDKTILRSPMEGIVTKQEIKVGEIVSANSLLISLISQANFEIEANIPEADIAKVNLNDQSSVTLDAYGDEINFRAQVTAIDPAETIIEGVPTYKVTLQFLDNDTRIKSGLTANIDILTDERQAVLDVPYRAIISRNGDKIVRLLLPDNTIREVQIKTGLRSSDGQVEILDGLNEGDRVVVFIKE